MIQDLIFTLFCIVFVMMAGLNLSSLLTWIERKVAAIMADRIGANRAYIRVPFTSIKFVGLGLFHGIADGAKMFLKESFRPKVFDTLCYELAPIIVMIPGLLILGIIPFAGVFRPEEFFSHPLFSTFAETQHFLMTFFADKVYHFSVASFDVDLLIVLALGGLGIIAAILAGWSSYNKFSLLGALRAAAQMVSYEIAMGVTLLSIVLTFGTLNFQTMVAMQSGTTLGFLPSWGIFLQPLAAVLFLTAAMAENKRAPFDLPECESELVSGYFTEYSAMKMGFFMLSEFIEIIVISALFSTMFLGGFNLPFMSDAGFAFPNGTQIPLSHTLVVFLQIATFVVKTMMVATFQVHVRWTLPRFRYDQLMSFGWKFLLPIATFNLILTAVLKWINL